MQKRCLCTRDELACYILLFLESGKTFSLSGFSLETSKRRCTAGAWLVGSEKKTKQKKITRVRPTPHFHRQEGASSPASSCLMVFYEMAPERERETEGKTIKVKLQLNQNEIDLCTFYRTGCQTWIQLSQRYEKKMYHLSMLNSDIRK